MNKAKQVGNEVLRGMMLFGMIISGFGLLMSPMLPVQDATHEQAFSFRSSAALIMGLVFIVCGVVRWKLSRQASDPQEKEQE